MTTDHRGTATARILDRRPAARSGRGPSASRTRRAAHSPLDTTDVAAEVTPSCVAALLATGVRSLLAERGVESVRPTERTRLAGGALLSASEVTELTARLEIALRRGYGLVVRLDAGAERRRTLGSLARHVAALAAAADAAPPRARLVPA